MGPDSSRARLELLLHSLVSSLSLVSSRSSRRSDRRTGHTSRTTATATSAIVVTCIVIPATVEQNTMFRMHRVTVVLEMVVELRLHGWPMDLILRAVHRRRRDGCESYSSVEALIKAAAKDQM